jgi:hypothetical protein
MPYIPSPQDLARTRRPPPRLFRRWTRAQRLTFVWVAFPLSFVLALALIVAMGVIVNLPACRDLGASAFNLECHTNVSYVTCFLGAGLLVALFWQWCFLLMRISNVPKEIDESNIDST